MLCSGGVATISMERWSMTPASYACRNPLEMFVANWTFRRAAGRRPALRRVGVFDEAFLKK